MLEDKTMEVTREELKEIEELKTHGIMVIRTVHKDGGIWTNAQGDMSVRDMIAAKLSLEQKIREVVKGDVISDLKEHEERNQQQLVKDFAEFLEIMKQECEQ